MAVAVWAGSCHWAVAANEAETGREMGRIGAERLNETSGLAVSRQNPDMLWLHNDGGNKRVFAVASDGTLAARVRLPAGIDDTEDIAIGSGPEIGVDFIYLGDIGDNDEKRREIRVIRFAEPDLSQAADSEKEREAEQVTQLRLRYPDGPHDAEALMVDSATGDLYIATKENRRSRLYRAAAENLQPGGVAVLELAAFLNVGDISGGDISRAGDLLVLRSEEVGWLWRRRPGEDLAEALKRAPRAVITRGPRQDRNGEAIGFSPDGRGYFTVSEGKNESIYYFPIAPATDDSTP
jgi:hypothetical protein